MLFWASSIPCILSIPNPGLQIREIPDPQKPTTDPLVEYHDWYQFWQEMYVDYDSKNIQQKLGNNVLTILIDTENKKPYIT